MSDFNKKLFVMIALFIIMCSFAGCECEHDFSEWKITQQSFCEVEGVKERICSICQTVEKDSIPALEHSFTIWNVIIPSTCFAQGTEASICNKCGKEETRNISLIDHNFYGAIKVIKEPTCTEQGIKRIMCTNCDSYKEEPIDLIEHKFDSGKVTAAATCTKEGVKTYTCVSCPLTKTEPIPKSAHQFDSGKITTSPTCTSEGVKTYTCTGCPFTKTESVVKLQHTFDSGKVTTEPTCIKEGVKTYSCTGCSHTKTESIAKIDHKYDSGVAADSGAIVYTCPMCNKQKINVPAIVKKSHTVKAIDQKQKTIESAKILTYKGNIAVEDQIDEYTYTVINGGRARVEISGLKSGASANLYVYDSNGSVVAYATYCKNNEGVTLGGLKSGQKYKIQVRHNSGYSAYTLSIGQPKPVVDVSSVNVINDSIDFRKQYNIYSFTVPLDGRYRFDISGMQSGNRVDLYIIDSLGYSVGYQTYCKNGDGVTLKGLKGGEVYQVQVRYNNGFGIYTLSIGMQKPAVDITEISEISESIQYTDQRNVYTMTIPETGRYRFDISGMQSGMRVDLYIFDSLGETVGYQTYCKNGYGVTIKDLKAGKVYEVQVRYNDGFGDYTLSIGKQKPVVDVSSDVVISDSIEHIDQRNVYKFVADKSGTHTFTISGLKDRGFVELYAFNKLDETVAYDSYCYNGESITLKNLKPGDEYEIQVRYNSGLSSYTLTIN